MIKDCFGSFEICLNISSCPQVSNVDIQRVLSTVDIPWSTIQWRTSAKSSTLVKKASKWQVRSLFINDYSELKTRKYSTAELCRRYSLYDSKIYLSDIFGDTLHTDKCVRFGFVCCRDFQKRSRWFSLKPQCFSFFCKTGRARLTCDIDERWNGPPPRCEPIRCDPPATVAHSQIQIDEIDIEDVKSALAATGGAAPGNRSLFVGSIVTYTCDKGYRLTGNRQLLCLPSGSYDRPAPICTGEYWALRTTYKRNHVSKLSDFNLPRRFW